MAEQKAEEIIQQVEKTISKEESQEFKEKLIEQTKTNEAIERSKKYSLKDAAFVNATVGFGDNYISAYAEALKASPHHFGLLTAIPNLIAPLAGLTTSKAMEKTSRRKIFSVSILFQSLFWLPIIMISFLFLKDIKLAPLLLIIFYTIYALFGNFASPAWVSWMSDLVKKDKGYFFGLRNKIGGLVAMLSMVAAGILLNFFKSGASGKSYMLFIGFSLIFFLAMVFRLISRHYVLKQYEPEFKFKKEHYFSFFQFIKNSYKRSFGKFAIYLALTILATNIAAPYYSLYMLRDLNFSYTKFMIINVSASMATFLFMTRWGKFSDRFGNIATVKITSLLIPLTAFFWPLSLLIKEPYNFYFLILANFISGFSWAGFNLAGGNIVYDISIPDKKSLCSAYSGILSGLGVVLGALIGSFLISNLDIKFMNIIMLVSIISGLVRYGVSIFMLGSIKEKRVIEEKPRWEVVPLASEVYKLNSIITEGVLIKKLKEIGNNFKNHIRKLRRTRGEVKVENIDEFMSKIEEKKE